MNTCKVIFCVFIDYIILKCYIVIKCNQEEHMKDKKVLRSVRLEQELDGWVKVKAKAADRSFNAEINRTLRQVKESEKTEQAEKLHP